MNNKKQKRGMTTIVCSGDKWYELSRSGSVVSHRGLVMEASSKPQLLALIECRHQMQKRLTAQGHARNRMLTHHLWQAVGGFAKDKSTHRV